MVRETQGGTVPLGSKSTAYENLLTRGRKMVSIEPFRLGALGGPLNIGGALKKKKRGESHC